MALFPVCWGEEVEVPFQNFRCIRAVALGHSREHLGKCEEHLSGRFLARTVMVLLTGSGTS